MQRRKPAQAHISPPASKAGSFDLDRPPSRLSQRSLGVTNRIWIIVALFIVLLTITHYILPSASYQPQVYSNAHLTAKNYLNTSDETPNPFDFCPVMGPGDQVGQKYGARVVSQSRLHLGSGARIQRVLHRALAGQPVTISVLGGSVSACHGSGDDPISSSCYPSKFFQWWNTVFPNPASELTNGAMRRADSAYFAYCSAHHIPDVTDLVIIELDTDDSPDNEMMEHFEVLIRSILLRPRPTCFPKFTKHMAFAGPDHWHNVVAQFYDVPHISTKAALFSDYMHDTSSVDKYYVDPVLASPQGHDLISDILVAYFQNEIWPFGGVGLRKGVPEPGKKQGAEHRPKDYLSHLNSAPINVPMARINTRPNSGRPFQEISPYCVSANDLINPLPPSLFAGSGWSAFHPSTGSSSLQAKAHYWYSNLPTSRLRIPITIGAGDVGIYYIKEPISQIGEGSSIECWVDDNYAGAKVIENAANIGEPTAKLEMIDHFVARGSHYVECEVGGEEGQQVPMFKIIGIFTT
ncbi:Cap64 protein [Flagelloscypha sp. PMI_526]|nr:Cap64 protein [Flagelloscypha sp. PMI_526]